jgi:hypothetical protein
VKLISPPNGAESQEYVDLHLHPPIRLHCVVLDYLSTGTTLPLALDVRWMDVWRDKCTVCRSVSREQENG